jgi:hypothetical protein
MHRYADDFEKKNSFLLLPVPRSSGAKVLNIVVGRKIFKKAKPNIQISALMAYRMEGRDR